MTEVQQLLQQVPTGLFINGEFVAAQDGATFDVTNPATGEVLATLASGGTADAQAAMDAAAAAQAEWAATTPVFRANLLRKAYERVLDLADDFATLMTLEMGKPLDQAHGEVIYGANYLRHFAEEATRLYGINVPNPEGNLLMSTRRKPVGPCLLITPWNFPLAMATRKIAPALAAGCTAVVKPAKLTPLTTQLFIKVLHECGLPKGVVNVVSGSSASAISNPLMADSRLRKVSFTGSTAVGKQLLKSAAENVLRTSMELGGNAPFIVCADADIDAAVEGAMGAKMRNIGEACTAANRFLVHSSVVAEFTEKFVAAMQAQTVGNGLDEGVNVGPLITAQAVKDMEALVANAVAQGAQVACGGKAIAGPGNFFEPTVLTNVPTTARVFKEEIFGPIAPIFTFETLEEAVELANDTEYGLACYFYTQTHTTALRLADQLEYGIVGYNSGVISNAAAPFGGVKQSGMGREGGAEGIAEYTEVQYMGTPRA